MKNFLFFFLACLFFSLVFSFLFLFFLWPEILKIPYFSTRLKYFLKERVEVYPVEKIYLTENFVLPQLVKEKEDIVFTVKTEKKTYFNGFFLSRDGLGIAPYFKKGEIFYQGKKIDFKILETKPIDRSFTLLILKFNGKNFKTAPFSKEISLGENLFSLSKNEYQKTIVGRGIITYLLNEKILFTDLSPFNLLIGTPVFDFKGNVLGMIYEKKEFGKVISISFIWQLIGL